MDQAHISELSPELAAIESKQFRATVTLIWPYSSSARQFALLLAEPDLRLRRKNGQVRARFTGPSARAIATTGVGIGDEVVLSLRGAEFVKEGAVSTPGKSIGWELSYTETVVVQVYRNGSETANLQLVDAAPTPAPGSPVRPAAPTPAREFSSPAFLKRARLSDGPFFQAPYDPLADETEDGHDKKRRRKSYRDWKAWTYSARTPSPEKDDTNMEEELESVDASPSRAELLPRTPVSPKHLVMLSVAAGPLSHQEDEQTEPNTPTDEDASAADESSARPKKDADCYDLYAGPGEHPPSDAQYAFGGDTEVDTEVNTEEEGTTHGELNAHSTSTTEPDTEEQEHGQLERVQEHVVENHMVASAHAVTGKDAIDLTREECSLENVQVPSEQEPVLAIESGNHANNELTLAMPPPTLSNFPTITAGLLTPIGQEPASPTLAPQDASNLPLPSPFPGEHDNNGASYFGITTSTERLAEADATEGNEQDVPSEASYIGETSFFSSIGSSRASVFHPNHESAFTPVRFTFGMDGAGFSRPMGLSSPAPEAQPIEERAAKIDIPTSPTPPEDRDSDSEAENTSTSRQSTPESGDADKEDEDIANASPKVIVDEPGDSEVIVLSSQDDEDDSSETEMESTTAERPIQPDTAQQPEENSSMANDMHSTTKSLEETADQELPSGIQDSTAKSAISDLGSAPDDDKEIDTRREPQQPDSSRQSSPSQAQSPAMDLDSHSEFVNLDFATADAHALITTEERTITHTQSQEPESDAVPRQTEEPLSPAGHPPEPILEATDDYLQDAFPTEHALFDQQHEQIAGLEHDYQSDVRVEWVEEASVFKSEKFNNQLAPEDTAQAAAEGVSQRSSTTPEDDQEVAGMDAAPETPARNTRSKAKNSPLRSREKAPISTLNTRPRGPVTSIARLAISPPRTRTRSIFSPSQESTQSSPYSLRSQSRMSPKENVSVGTTSSFQKGSRKRLLRRSEDSVPDIESFQTQDHDRLVSSFQPSQELGASQGRYSDVAIVKDSEEESVRSEHSISTMHPSDMEYMHHSDPVDRALTALDVDDVDIKPPPATAPELVAPSKRAKGRKPNAQAIAEETSSSPTRPKSSYVTQSLVSSPGMQRPVARSEATTTPSPQNVRKTRRKVYELPSESQKFDQSSTPKASRKLSKHMSVGEGEGSHGVVEIDELMRSSTPTSPRIDQRTRERGRNPLTPNATQQTAMESQLSFDAHQGRNTLLTPQLTQTASAGLRSSQTDAEIDLEAAAALPNANTTPRRKQRSTEAATTSVSPTLIDPSSDDAIMDTPESPSVGLSTPLAYYTPLKDLLYFLNRSSQFHSAANPDILALVTSPTTPSEKAKKGAKHWLTTLSVTDASIWPQTTTVQIFRAYQNALPEAQVGDVILLRAFAVKSLNRHPMLVSADESAWCVWRWGKPVWGAKRGAFGELRAREETKGPAVEKGVGEWREVERLRVWYTAKVQRELAVKEEARVRTRSKDKGKEADVDT